MTNTPTQTESLDSARVVEPRLPVSRDAEGEDLLVKLRAALQSAESERDRIAEYSRHAQDGKTFIDSARAEVEQWRAEVRVARESAVADGSTVQSNLATTTTAKAEIDAARLTYVGTSEEAAKHSAILEESKRRLLEATANCDELVKLRTDATQDSALIKGHVGSVTQAAQDVQTKASQVNELKGRISESSGQIDTFRTQAQANAATTKSLADIAERTEVSVTTYEKSLDEKLRRATQLVQQIESLLPGATSAGLASAFHTRGTTYSGPKARWQALFLLSVVSLGALALNSFGIFSDLHAAASYELLGLGLLQRLPVVVPLIWLAIHSARQANIAARLEEDYAYKKVMSQSFEGYRQELSKIATDAPADSPVRQLCIQVLTVMSAPPGRLYDSKHDETMPVAMLLKELQKIRRGEAN